MRKDKKMCVGCYNNFYNSNNSYGIKECWFFKDAKIVKKVRVGLWQNPPYHQEPLQVLNCYYERGYAFLNVNDPRVKHGKALSVRTPTEEEK